MTRYVYKAVNAAGGSVVGKVDADRRIMPMNGLRRGA